MGGTEPVLWCPGQLRNLQFPGAGSPRLEWFIYSPVSLDWGFLLYWFLFVLHLLYKTLRLSALEMLKGLQASFLALLMHKRLKERLKIWYFFFLLRISGRLLQLYTKRMKHPSLPSTPSSSLTGQPSHHWLLWHYGHLSWHLSVSSWRRDIRFPQFPRQNQGSVFLSNLDGVGKVAFVCKWWPGLVLSRLLKL